MQLPVADGVLEGTAVAVRVQWDQAQADAHAAQDAAVDGVGRAAGALADAAAVFEVGTRLWKEDSGRLPPRSPSQVCLLFCLLRVTILLSPFVLFKVGPQQLQTRVQVGQHLQARRWQPFRVSCSGLAEGSDPAASNRWPTLACVEG